MASEQDIVLAGRYSEWEHYDSDNAFLAGKRAAQTVKPLRAVRQSRHLAKTAILPSTS